MGGQDEQGGLSKLVGGLSTDNLTHVQSKSSLVLGGNPELMPEGPRRLSPRSRGLSEEGEASHRWRGLGRSLASVLSLAGYLHSGLSV